MLRAFSLFGFGGLFLLISPKLRESVWGALDSGVSGMEQYAPYSYVAAVFMLLVVVAVSLYRGAQPQ